MGVEKKGSSGLRTMVWFRKVSFVFCFAFFLVFIAVSRRRSKQKTNKKTPMFSLSLSLPSPQGLRLHDNPALLEAATVGNPSAMFPVFVLDPHFLKPQNVGVNRYAFLLESLRDLDASLRARGSRLVVLRGRPEEELPKAWRAWGVGKLTFERDTEPYARARDSAVRALAEGAGVEVRSFSSHTLWDPDAFNGISSPSSSSSPSSLPPLTYQAFLKQAHAKLGAPSPPLAAKVPDHLPPAPGEEEESGEGGKGGGGGDNQSLPGPCPVPQLGDLPAYAGLSPSSPFRGGETAGLARLAAALSDDAAVAAFEKPKTDPTALLSPSTTVLSPYLKFGCVSAREVHARVQESLARARKKGLRPTEPPVSLEGQLLWREFYYCVAAGVGPAYYGYEGNPICRRVPWDDDRRLLEAWSEARTGFPWIDAAMTQLRVEGWIHHLARHAVVSRERASEREEEKRERERERVPFFFSFPFLFSLSFSPQRLPPLAPLLPPPLRPLNENQNTNTTTGLLPHARGPLPALDGRDARLRPPPPRRRPGAQRGQLDVALVLGLLPPVLPRLLARVLRAEVRQVGRLRPAVGPGASEDARQVRVLPVGGARERAARRRVRRRQGLPRSDRRPRRGEQGLHEEDGGGVRREQGGRRRRRRRRGRRRRRRRGGRRRGRRRRGRWGEREREQEGGRGGGGRGRRREEEQNKVGRRGPLSSLAAFLSLSLSLRASARM